ncbi:hypothetical protein GEMRC1_005473 [Eukaryota sp. GEM-RC1]
MKQQNVISTNEVKLLKESILPWLKRLQEREEERLQFEDSIGTFNPDNCCSCLTLFENNHVVKTERYNNGHNSFVEVNLPDNHSVKFTRLDDVDDGHTDSIGWKDSSGLSNNVMAFPGLFY